ncbi:Limonene 1,2-monooxygenase [Pseudidiomarina piscicola]|uniref:Luciferase-like monooxygenase n=1 Tax=Pseudidiomarina piscicola TaxID=2614830 RepID=A0A6S6WV89_9GAMM|nr:LLM class flavin-dependent oxidoreductase [Pseudidiomarina piscicola]CAB0151350.1 Limonene 1,2-monooxygenase [Pseudidiomarina piscicola]VZT40831.1 Limonene 1,2-monooxygenase [Pseudomonas aeruginosa]
MVALSVLDLAPITAESSAKVSLQRSTELAQHVEKLGYQRFWMAEHHNMTGIASAATAVALAHIGSRTESIRIGAGGIMLPNHAPLIAAEQFGTLAALYGDRVDLGLGRAPGTDAATLRALRRTYNSADRFPDDVQELLDYLDDPNPAQQIKAVPGSGSKVPVWILGSSLFGAQLAAKLGLPYAFASHFAPDHLQAALETYRQQFRPSKYLAAPHAMAVVNVFAADDEQAAKRMKSSMQLQFIALRKGNPGPLPAPVDAIEEQVDPMALAAANHALKYTASGTPEQVHTYLDDFVAATGVDELMLTCHAYDHQARMRSFEIASGRLS